MAFARRSSPAREKRRSIHARCRCSGPGSARSPESCPLPVCFCGPLVGVSCGFFFAIGEECYIKPLLRTIVLASIVAKRTRTCFYRRDGNVLFHPQTHSASLRTRGEYLSPGEKVRLSQKRWSIPPVWPLWLCGSVAARTPGGPDSRIMKKITGEYLCPCVRPSAFLPRFNFCP